MHLVGGLFFVRFMGVLCELQDFSVLEILVLSGSYLLVDIYRFFHIFNISGK